MTNKEFVLSVYPNTTIKIYEFYTVYMVDLGDKRLWYEGLLKPSQVWYRVAEYVSTELIRKLEA